MDYKELPKGIPVETGRGYSLREGFVVGPEEDNSDTTDRGKS